MDTDLNENESLRRGSDGATLFCIIIIVSLFALVFVLRAVMS